MVAIAFQIISIVLLFFTLYPLWQLYIFKKLVLSHANVAPVHEVMQAIRCTTLNIIHLDCNGADAPEILSEME